MTEAEIKNRMQLRDMNILENKRNRRKNSGMTFSPEKEYDIDKTVRKKLQRNIYESYCSSFVHVSKNDLSMTSDEVGKLNNDLWKSRQSEMSPMRDYDNCK